MSEITPAELAARTETTVEHLHELQAAAAGEAELQGIGEAIAVYRVARA